MTTTDAPPESRASLPLTAPRLPNWAPALVLVVAFGAAGLLALLAGWGITAFVALAAVIFIAALPLWSASVEGRRGAVDRLMTSLVWTAFAAAVIPLVWLIWTVLDNGLAAINAAFLTYDMRNVVGDDQGGIYHAIIGTLLVTLAAAIISVPVGLFCAIYLVEYGKGKRLARWITFLVDVMTGIPSIVAGLFALALFVLIFGPEIRLGFGGSVALSLLMIPIVVRSTEEMLRLVPDDLREASYALGVPKWRTIMKVVLPTSHRRHHHRHHAGHRARDRRDRTAAGHRRQDRLGELQPLRRADDDAAGLHLLLVHPAGHGAVRRPARDRGRPASRAPGAPRSSSSSS